MSAHIFVEYLLLLLTFHAVCIFVAARCAGSSNHTESLTLLCFTILPQMLITLTSYKQSD